MLLMAEPVLFVVLASRAFSTRRTDEEFHMITVATSEETIKVSTSKELTTFFSDGIEGAVASDLSSIPEVQAVSIRKDGDFIGVWVGMDNPSEKERYKVYDKELSIINEFKNSYFDFNLIPLYGRDLASVVGSRAILAFDRSRW